MKFDLKTWIIVGLAVVIALLLLLGGGRDERDIRKIAELEAKNKATDEQILDKDKTITKLRVRIAQDAILFKDTITIIKEQSVKLERNLARQRAKPEIIKIISQNADIDTLVQTYDSIISKRDEQIYLQAKYVSQLQGDLSAVEANFREQIALHVQKFESEKKIADEYRDQARKERRKKKFNAILIPIVAVGAFLAGSAL